jgi:hypothetical protein
MQAITIFTLLVAVYLSTPTATFWDSVISRLALFTSTSAPIPKELSPAPEHISKRRTTRRKAHCNSFPKIEELPMPGIQCAVM